jgi:photosystem II stability/assembly factor-like uncharacterized protein
MKNLCIIFFLIFIVTESSAQKPRKWTRLKGPNLGIGAQVLWGANGEIISVGNTGIYISANDGKSWDYSPIVPATSNVGQSKLVIASDGNYYFQAGSQYSTPTTDIDFGVYRSTDFGDSWTHVFKNYSIIQLVAGTDNSLILKTYANGIFRSIDKGNSWIELPKLENASGIFFGATDKYVYVGYPGAVSRYSYNDQSTENFSNDLAAGYQYSFLMVDANHLLAIQDPVIYASDGEHVWTAIDTLRGIKSITKSAGNIISATVVSPSSGKTYIAKSTDGGKSWDSAAPVIFPSTNNNNNILFTSDINKILCENYNALFLSADRGQTWHEVGLPYANITMVLVSNDGNIFAYNQSLGSTEISMDKGESWQSSPIYYIGKGLQNSVLGVYGSEVMAYESGQWKVRSIVDRLNEGFSSYATPTIISDNSKYIYLTKAMSIYRSDDNAGTWLDMNVPSTGNYIYSIDASADGTVYYGLRQVMYRSEDHGVTWTKLLPVNNLAKLTSIKTFGSDGVLLGTEGDGLLISNDKGNSWTRLDRNNFDTVTCLAINSKGEISAGTTRGLWSCDSLKQHWQKISLGHDDNLYIGGLDVTKDDDFYAGTNGSSVWVGTTHYNSVYDRDNNSTMNISPNPASAIVNISANSSEDSKLELYDMLGRRLSIIADGNISTVQFSTSTLANGIYTIMLTSSEKRESQKLVVQH